MICFQKFKSQSGFVPKHLAMICGQKFNSLSGVHVYSCTCVSGVVQKLAMISGRKSNHLSYVHVASNLATIFHHMSGKFVTASYTRLPVKASVKSFFTLTMKRN